ncbi:holo-ACP synthase [Alteromonas sp. SM 2104]|nr:holo-ACP synthase [Alteromonas oceanisediminis]
MGLGTDIVEIERIEAQVAKSGRLAERILTPAELATFSQHHHPARFLAKRFAAKEAAVKALGTGIGHGVSWQNIQVENSESGQPSLRFSGEFEVLCVARGITHSFVSISDEQRYAMATVVLEAQGVS